MTDNLAKPDYIFEVSWEVCNKVGGIHTVVATKSVALAKEFGNNIIMIGPDLVKDVGENPEFERDPNLYHSWKQQAESENLKIKIGRWKISSHPIAILVDFSDYVTQKDAVFSRLWEQYKLDSLSGQWDYIEPAIFGYVVGKVIESFVKFNLTSNEKCVAQFHEWMTGSGLLYLKKEIPQVATAFTTHATVLGRCLAGNNRPLYKNISKFNPDEVAKEFNITSKQSLEKMTALEADVFTTVSDITANECKYFLSKPVDIVTPNGFENSIIPKEEEYEAKKKLAREKMLKTAEALTGNVLSQDTFIVATSGRYEYKNKGIDLYIDALQKLASKIKSDRKVLAFCLIPANHYGPRKDLLRKMEDPSVQIEGSKLLTHNLHDAEWDPILNNFKKCGFTNSKDEKVQVIFVPSYLNGSDGVFNLPYYDLLIGCDQTVFASYYEPWGYTPLESLAFSVPTITTSLAGFGLWANKITDKPCQSIIVIERNDENDQQVSENITKAIFTNYQLSMDELNKCKKHAFEISQTALWSSLVENYLVAYDIAMSKIEQRADQFIEILDQQTEKFYQPIAALSNEPRWNRIIVKSKLPERLEVLNDLMDNIWWTWDTEAQELFEDIDASLWIASDYNPEVLLEQVAYGRLTELSTNKKYIEKLDSVIQRFRDYMSVGLLPDTPKIAYFSMEFGFHDSLKLFSGGLGILAGDYLKEASDAQVDIVGVGILYRFGYFTQMITLKGEQQSIYDYQHFSKIPIHPLREPDGEFKKFQIMLPGRIMYSRIWQLNVGRIKLILLDTDFDENVPEDRQVSHQLYGGDNENRLKQEILLGVGGIRALDLLGINPDLYHSNEGHSAFIGLERIRVCMKENQLTFDEAKELVRSSTLFTTHTPVPAGHDHFDENLIRKYMGHYPERIRISWEEFMALGRANPNDWSEKYNMSYLAAHLAQEVNGVSMLHGAVTREMFTRLWPGFVAEELHISYVTNGVHWSTWTAKEWKDIYQKIFAGMFIDQQLNKEKWNNIREIDDAEIWNTKESLRTKLINAVKERFKENWIKRHEDPKQIIAINNTLSEKALTVVFARRFATYKRAHLLFRNLERLEKIVNDPKKPVQFIFAGKAHPNDKAGQDLIKMITEISKRPEFIGKILFLQNYSINLAKLLVSGADVWLNTPTRPLEASGTSGEKAVMNGTLHFSVLDGWWVEGYKPDAGWALSNERTYDNQGYQDDLDAEIIYSLFENEIIPAFYKRNKDNVPVEWVSFIKNTIAEVSPKFTTRRMIQDYIDKFYNKLYERTKHMRADDFEYTKEISKWKKHTALAWDNIEIIGIKLYGKNTETIEMGTEYAGQVVLDLNGLPPENVGVELVITEKMNNLIGLQEFKLTKIDEGKAFYTANINVSNAGTFNYGLRVYPKSEYLPHRQDFGLLKWI